VAAIQAEDLDDTRLQTLKAARQARIVVWPEYVSTTRNHIAYDTARKARVYIVASYQEDVPNGRPHNVAHLISSRGKLLGLFRKQHLFGREKFVFARGNPRLPIGVDGLKVGVPICYDTQIPDVSRRLARDGANLLMVPNSDPWMPNGLFGYLHSAIIPFRAAENGIPIAWSEHSGLSTIIDGDGSTLAQAPLHTVGYAAARVTPRSRRTFYTMAGDYFAYMCAGGLVVVVVLCWKPRGDN